MVLMMNNTPHVMVDLETLASSNNAVIVSIGAVAFNPDTGEINPETFYITVDGESCQQVGMQISAKTVMWWLEQSTEARAALKGGVPLRDALTAFRQWSMRTAGPELSLWGNGATFDNIILRNAYSALGQYVPWKYNKDFCYRTMKNMFPGVLSAREGTHHNALDDAMTQTKHLCAIFESIRAGGFQQKLV